MAFWLVLCRARGNSRLFFALLCFLLLTRVGLAQDSGARGDFRLELETEIGREFGKPEESFSRIWDIVVSPSDRIYVLDLFDSTVKMYSSDGEFVGAFGRKGQGPGEFVRPAELQFADFVIHVFDAGQHRVSTFTLDGTHVETRRLPSLGLNITRAFRLRTGDVLAVTTPVFSPGQDHHDPNVRLVLWDSLAGALDTVFSYHSGGTVWHPPGARVPWGIADGEFGPGGAWALHGDSVLAVADGYTGLVRWYTARGHGLSSIGESRLPVSSRPVTQSDLEKLEEDFRRTQESMGEPAGPVTFEPPPRWSVARSALFADDGSLWIGTGRDSEGHRLYSVFGPDRRLVARVALPSNFGLSAIVGNRLYGKWKTELDADIVRIYRLMREPRG